MKTVTIEIMDGYDDVIGFACIGTCSDGRSDATNVITYAIDVKDNLHLKQVYNGKIGNDGFKHTHFVEI